MIIDCHGHYTTSPRELSDYRDRLLGGAHGAKPRISDDQIRESIEPHQLRLQRERGIDLTLFSPTASRMGHELANRSVIQAWTEECNNLVHRARALFPGRFAPVCQLPQSTGGSLDLCVAELRRTVERMGFVGCNLNPDPSGGFWRSKPLGDRHWYPLYEAMVELDVPAMIHAGRACHPALDTTTSHYLGADTTALVQLLHSDVFRNFPAIRFILPHGGGAVPYHWGRLRSITLASGMGHLEDRILGNVWFDTCLYDQAAIDLLLSTIPRENILFGSEALGAVEGNDPRTGHAFDDTRRLVEANATLGSAGKAAVFEHNARRVFPRLKTRPTGSNPGFPGPTPPP